MTAAKKPEQGNAIDLTEVLKGYEDKWVVLSPDKSEVLASGEEFDSLKPALGKGSALKVPKFVPFIPANIV